MDKSIKTKDLIGLRFINGGRDVRKGLDCWGLVMEVYSRMGIIIPDFTVDAFAFQAINALAGKEIVNRQWEEVLYPKGKKNPLIVLMRMHPKYITHAGVLISENKIIHTTKTTGVITSRADALNSRIAGYYRYVQNN